MGGIKAAYKTASRSSFIGFVPVVLATVTHAQTVLVDSTQPWSVTGILASGGQAFRITATGSVDLATTSGSYFVDPDGTITRAPAAGSSTYEFMTSGAAPIGVPPTVGGKKMIIGWGLDSVPLPGAPYGMLVAGF